MTSMATGKTRNRVRTIETHDATTHAFMYGAVAGHATHFLADHLYAAPLA
jgi:hypothetical protein